ncbi:DUF805 domain-containing protein [Flavobacterium lacus]|jgi:uncharacterized membrane protein YhaH (DUF805 family)|uniref:Uncharacterized membrane protein YhaH (DUF805 family) n=1 Tax=Flavobacterium lacus TaxID=1353778 RepID=A0A328WPF7_9FLAO|nr:DUF805 domain-containing protein [Flavobacterium lacus]RAR48013.1 uncharacterized membrane protein YhaH (DUF805 family) [Flavobacterium lacus]
MKYYLEVLKKYAVFNGRARRKEYWMFTLFHLIFYYFLIFVDVYLETVFLNTIYILAVLIPSISVGVRRMHDVGKSGWYLLIPIYSFILACTEGDYGQNKYGSDPKNTNLEINEIGQE